MTDIGVLGLDTSHGEAFAAVLDDLSSAEDAATDTDAPTIAAVWDGGAVRDDAYVASFCADWNATRYDTPAAMVDDVDAAMVLAVDWERHVPLARPFLEAGVPTLVDKPVAGSLGVLERLAEAAGSAPLFGGSALPYHPEFARLPEAADDRTLHVAGYNDYFYYRVHAVDAARRVVGADWTRVEPVTEAPGTTVAVAFADGTWATLRFDGATDEPSFGALDVADRTRTAAVGSGEGALREMYEPYLEAFLEVVDGTRTAPTSDVLDAARLLLAVEAALDEDRTVTPGDDALAAVERPSDSFVAEYEPYY